MKPGGRTTPGAPGPRPTRSSATLSSAGYSAPTTFAPRAGPRRRRPNRRTGKGGDDEPTPAPLTPALPEARPGRAAAASPARRRHRPCRDGRRGAGAGPRRPVAALPGPAAVAGNVARRAQAPPIAPATAALHGPARPGRGTAG